MKYLISQKCAGFLSLMNINMAEQTFLSVLMKCQAGMSGLPYYYTQNMSADCLTATI